MRLLITNYSSLPLRRGRIEEGIKILNFPAIRACLCRIASYDLTSLVLSKLISHTLTIFPCLVQLLTLSKGRWRWNGNFGPGCRINRHGPCMARQSQDCHGIATTLADIKRQRPFPAFVRAPHHYTSKSVIFHASFHLRLSCIFPYRVMRYI